MKKKKTSKNRDDLPPVLKQMLDLLNVNPTSKYLVKMMGKDKRLVARDINRLIKLNKIQRIDRGVFKVIKDIKKSAGGYQSHQRKGDLQPKKDDTYFRLHNLELGLKLTKESYKAIKNIIFKDQSYFNVHEFGNVGHYFSYDVTGLITKSNMFIFFPEDFELTAKTQKELMILLYDTIKRVLQKWESKFHLVLEKSGRFNFDIRNVHIAIINKDVVKELERKEIHNMTITDDTDGKLRFVIDMSKGFPEIEAVHPEKAIEDSDEIRYLIEKTGDGKVREILNTYPSLISLFSTFLHTQDKVNKDFNNMVMLQIAQSKANLESKPSTTQPPSTPPDYVG